MAKILSIDNMLDAASECDLPDRDHFVEKFEALATELGDSLAKHLGILMTHPGDYQHGFGGLCVNFGPAIAGQECPEVIDRGDEGGDWEDVRDHYVDGVCPDCQVAIPHDVAFGDACKNCGHVFNIGKTDDNSTRENKPHDFVPVVLPGGDLGSGPQPAA